ncbi:thioesterase II family protein [Streptomyces jumonjinensis]|uniref:thioesterase II family protein n=1 Tax=Streptomyces jumonjinensis TaxID=1945 RepID=UPI0037AD4345
MTWLSSPAPRPGARQRLICFAHAGGSAHFYRGWAEALPDLEVHAVHYPGRAHRIDEPTATDLRGLAGEIAEGIRHLNDRPLALFGHSMGAVVAFETALRLRETGVRVSHVFASAARAPQLPGVPIGDGGPLDEDAVAEALIALGGTDAQALADPMLRELILPYVCADLIMLDAYVHRPGSRLDCPVTAIVGDADQQVGAAHADAWAEVTSGPFRRRIVSGDHFYLTPRPPFALIGEALSPLSTHA